MKMNVPSLLLCGNHASERLYIGKRWLMALLIAMLFGDKASADCVPSRDTPASVIEYFFKNSTSRCRNSSASRRTQPPKLLRNPLKSIRKPMRTLRNSHRLSAGATMLSHPLTTSLFQSPIPLPLEQGLATLNLLARELSGSIRRAMGYPLCGHVLRY